tara:strand:+ start:996 stop:1304 length:309 start_codon:yes stop_codon:yes gene_type:complete
VGSHELKGSIAYFNCLTAEEHKKIGIPLVVLVDYMGFRLVAESLLPINKNSLIYGTSDAGKTMHCDDPEFNKVSCYNQTNKSKNKHKQTQTKTNTTEIGIEF